MDFNFFLSALPQQARDEVSGFYNYGGSAGNPYANIDPYRYGGMDQRDAPADKLYADLIRAQTQDYMTRFAPVETMLASEITATGTKQLPEDLRRTRDVIGQTSENVMGQQRRQAQRYGVDYDPSLTANNSTVSAMVGGLNDTRMRDVDRRQALLTGGLGAVGQKARGVGG